jgi:hypothetical protein
MKKTKGQLIAIFCFIIILLPPVLRAEFGEKGVVLSGPEGRVLLQQCSRLSPEGVTGVWTPSEKDIRQLEADFLEFIRDKRPPNRDFLLKDYYRQYTGFMRGGKKFIYVNGFSHSIKGHDRRKNAYVVCDGGGSFFGVEYNVDTRQFSHLEYNGEA